jgi:hypothetical protein
LNTRDLGAGFSTFVLSSLTASLPLFDSSKPSNNNLKCSVLTSVGWVLTVVWLTYKEVAMSARSIYLRDQAANCEWHAKNIRDDETEVALREMAARYVAEADDIESRELATRQMKETANFYDDTA